MPAEPSVAEVRRPRWRWLPPARDAKPRNGWLMLLLTFMTIGVYAIYWIYAVQLEHPRRRRLDPAPGLWLGVYIALVIVVLGLLGASGFGIWKTWGEASDGQQMVFASMLGFAVAFNVWFGLGTLRLTERLHHLLVGRPIADRSRAAKVALLLGLTCEMVAMVAPRLDQIELLPLPDEARLVFRLVGSLGTGSLLGWGITVHRQANELARLPSVAGAPSTDLARGPALD